MPIRNRERVERRIRDRADKLVRGVGMEYLGRLVMRTPVDTSRARANWNAALGEPDLAHDLDAVDPSGSQTIQRGTSVVLEFQAGEKLLITNSLPYVPVLERGSSKQAPQGMAAVTKAELAPLVSQVLAEIGRG
jgi:hypothetical protein